MKEGRVSLWFLLRRFDRPFLHRLVVLRMVVIYPIDMLSFRVDAAAGGMLPPSGSIAEEHGRSRVVCSPADVPNV
jgi:hypothetical protein